MMTMLGLDEALLRERSGFATAREILQQPETLRATAALVTRERARLAAFIDPLLARPDMRVVLTGAGSSAFIGQCLAPWLSRDLGCRVDAVATTDITGAPELYLVDCPTLLVSFARSGDSPESIAAVDLAERLLAECHHLTITCNASGKLAQRMPDVRSGATLCLPEATNDEGFAMTSSFTAMTLAAWGLLGDGDAMIGASDRIAASVSDVLTRLHIPLGALGNQDFDRVVYLGSHVLKGVACEAALKLLELTDGGIVAMHDTPLGFRHGPKTFVNPHTLAVIFLSNDAYSRKYDLDLARELVADGHARRVVVVDAGNSDVDGATRLHIAGLDGCADIELLFPMIAVAQILALHASLAHELTPDRPNKAGTVNRVVQGVRIHAVA